MKLGYVDLLTYFDIALSMSGSFTGHTTLAVIVHRPCLSTTAHVCIPFSCLCPAATRGVCTQAGPAREGVGREAEAAERGM